MCRAGRYNLCERVREPGFKLYGHTAPGALAEYAVRPAVALHKVPPAVTDLAAALVNQGALTVHAARRARLGPGASVAVFGPGLLGLLMLQVARAAGATTSWSWWPGPRLDIARDLGASAVVDYSREDPVAGVRAATGGRGADCVFDCSGNPAVVAQALRCARRGGTVALLGLAGGASAELPVDLVTLDELDVLGIRSSPNAYPAMIALLASGAIRTEPLDHPHLPARRRRHRLRRAGAPGGHPPDPHPLSEEPPRGPVSPPLLRQPVAGWAARRALGRRPTSLTSRSRWRSRRFRLDAGRPCGPVSGCGGDRGHVYVIAGSGTALGSPRAASASPSAPRACCGCCGDCDRAHQARRRGRRVRAA